MIRTTPTDPRTMDERRTGISASSDSEHTLCRTADRQESSVRGNSEALTGDFEALGPTVRGLGRGCRPCEPQHRQAPYLQRRAFGEGMADRLHRRASGGLIISKIDQQDFGRTKTRVPLSLS